MENNKPVVSGLKKFNQYLTHSNTSNYLTQVLGSKKEMFVANCASLVTNNADLQNCTPATVMNSAIKATALDLPLDNNLGFVYVLPYRNNKKGGIYEAQFQMGYKGFIQLALRTKQFRTINVSDVREGEIKYQDRLTGEIEFKWTKSDKVREKKKVAGYVCFFSLVNGFQKSLYMTVEELEEHGKKYSKSYNSQYSNWKKMFPAMAKKTVIKLLLSKFAPLSVNMSDAIKHDQAVIRGDETEYIDNDTTTINVEEVKETVEEKKKEMRKKGDSPIIDKDGQTTLV